MIRRLTRPFADAFDAWSGTTWLTCACRAATDPARYVPKHRAEVAS